MISGSSWRALEVMKKFWRLKDEGRRRDSFDVIEAMASQG
jgi:hypothetical protein